MGRTRQALNKQAPTVKAVIPLRHPGIGPHTHRLCQSDGKPNLSRRHGWQKRRLLGIGPGEAQRQRAEGIGDEVDRGHSSSEGFRHHSGIQQTQTQPAMGLRDQDLVNAQIRQPRPQAGRGSGITLCDPANRLQRGLIGQKARNGVLEQDLVFRQRKIHNVLLRPPQAGVRGAGPAPAPR